MVGDSPLRSSPGTTAPTNISRSFDGSYNQFSGRDASHTFVCIDFTPPISAILSPVSLHPIFCSTTFQLRSHPILALYCTQTRHHKVRLPPRRMMSTKKISGANVGDASFECCFCGRISHAEPRLFFNFQGTDGSGTKLFSAYTKPVEKLLETTLDDLLKMEHEEMVIYYNKLAIRFRTTTTCIELAPVPPSTADLHSIKWVLKDEVVE